MQEQPTTLADALRPQRRLLAQKDPNSQLSFNILNAHKFVGANHLSLVTRLQGNNNKVTKKKTSKVNPVDNYEFLPSKCLKRQTEPLVNVIEFGQLHDQQSEMNATVPRNNAPQVFPLDYKQNRFISSLTNNNDRQPKSQQPRREVKTQQTLFNNSNDKNVSNHVSEKDEHSDQSDCIVDDDSRHSSSDEIHISDEESEEENKLETIQEEINGSFAAEMNQFQLPAPLEDGGPIANQNMVVDYSTLPRFGAQCEETPIIAHTSMGRGLLSDNNRPQPTLGELHQMRGDMDTIAIAHTCLINATQNIEASQENDGTGRHQYIKYNNVVVPAGTGSDSISPCHQQQPSSSNSFSSYFTPLRFKRGGNSPFDIKHHLFPKQHAGAQQDFSKGVNQAKNAYKSVLKGYIEKDEQNMEQGQTEQLPVSASVSVMNQFASQTEGSSGKFEQFHTNNMAIGDREASRFQDQEELNKYYAQFLDQRQVSQIVYMKNSDNKMSCSDIDQSPLQRNGGNRGAPPDSSFHQINSPINLDSCGPQFKQRFEIVELFARQHGGEELLWDKSGDISVQLFDQSPHHCPDLNSPNQNNSSWGKQFGDPLHSNQYMQH